MEDRSLIGDQHLSICCQTILNLVDTLRGPGKDLISQTVYS